MGDHTIAAPCTKAMRITFVPEDQVTEQPEIEVREPEDEGG